MECAYLRSWKCKLLHAIMEVSHIQMHCLVLCLSFSMITLHPSLLLAYTCCFESMMTIAFILFSFTTLFFLFTNRPENLSLCIEQVGLSNVIILLNYVIMMVEIGIGKLDNQSLEIRGGDGHLPMEFFIA